jgi:hypothetical protein
MQYQLTEIGAQEAIEIAQDVADMVSRELQLDQAFVALEFLREELAAEGGGEAAETPESEPEETPPPAPDLPPPRGR